MMPREYKYKDLKKATNNFHESMRLGQGGFGIVYKGILQDKDHKTSTEIAVKKFSRDSIQSKDDFLAELTIIHRLRHKHLVRLVGNPLFIPLYLFICHSNILDNLQFQFHEIIQRSSQAFSAKHQTI